ncbi:MAG: RagB/SusD family nutrient uptake outer membrane protein [Gracilimonas sp.]|uniref:RagB/SusD family nutrient uptake outer membrane protein n=1 Tax=Gracilimonas sp. TaxID=1974203 RepID=UPI0019AE87BD|nr:RagB/SusD family nutrient uptake outer membrane protein [Gracilimonas sp.]MBD3615944.1 RagB/SusD family nutrient uptake outer membrane protein [Gracilimonas sp.]
MFNQTYKTFLIVLTVFLGFTATSCIDDLSTTPLDDDVVTSESVYNTPDDYKQVLAKLYAGFSTTGQQGPAGNADIQGIDEGFSSYVRQYFTHQENPTDEAIIGWGDEGLPDFNTMSWTASNDFVMGMYSRIYYTITMANEFLRNAEGRDEAVIQEYAAEARFLRALSYWHALDLFGGNVPFVTEEDNVGAEPPQRTNTADLFAFIESELLDIESQIIGAKQNEYGRADRGAVWMLLSKLYLNAEVYVGQDRYDDVITYTEKVIDEGGYVLHGSYGELFLADNHTADGIIFPITFDGVNTSSWGGTTFIAHAAVGGNMNAADFGLDGGWGGYRVTPQFVDIYYSGYQTSNLDGDDVLYVPGGYQGASGYGGDWTPLEAGTLVSDNNDGVYTGYVYFAEGAEFKFTEGDWGSQEYSNDNGNMVAGGGGNFSVAEGGIYYFEVDVNNLTLTMELNPESFDARETFFTDGQTKEVADPGDFSNGYTITKWKNITSNGDTGKNLTWVDIDFPMFRLADAYLMYAEATARGAAGGNIAKAVGLVNDLRERAYGGNVSANIAAGDLTPEFVLDERARELYWEGHRRTDLIRFGLFTSADYVWAWKGGTQEGTSVSDHFNIYPIPASDVNANPNLVQNPGY